MEEVVNVIHQTVQKSLLGDFQSYLSNHSDQKQFCIYSDYCLDDKNKLNSVASFTIAPIWTAFPELKNIAVKAIPKDIKKTKDLTDLGAQLIKNKAFFHISFVIKNTDGLLYKEGKTIQEVMIQGISETISMIEGWKKNQPQGIAKFTEQVKKFKKWQQRLKKNPNIKLSKQIILISAMVGYIAFLITKYAIATDIVWFSDRDKIIHSYDGVAYDLFDIWHYGLCEKYEAIEPYSKIGLGTSEQSTANLWFDHLIRLPDYLAGALSSWDTEENLVHMPKHASVLQKVFADNNFCSIINININKGVFNASRQTVSLTKQP